MVTQVSNLAFAFEIKGYCDVCETEVLVVKLAFATGRRPTSIGILCSDACTNLYSINPLAYKQFDYWLE